MSSVQAKPIILSLAVLALGLASAIYLLSLSHDTTQDDIYYAWVEGKRIISGTNPYERVLAGNLRDNDHYATYLPVFYQLSALSQRLGLTDYSAWISFWKPTLVGFYVLIGWLLFLMLYQKAGFSLALFSSLFWYFNRWTLHGALAAYLDFMPLFFLLASLLLFRWQKQLSLWLFSLSLAIKHLAIILLPLYLIWVWQGSGKNRARNTLVALAIVVSLPLVSALPFLWSNAEAISKSILFSLTRNPYFFGAISFDGLIGLRGIPAKAPLLFMLGLVYLGACRGWLRPFVSVLLAMFVFLYFNSVLFIQYICWVVPFIPLSLIGFKEPAGGNLKK